MGEGGSQEDAVMHVQCAAGSLINSGSIDEVRCEGGQPRMYLMSECQ